MKKIIALVSAAVVMSICGSCDKDDAKLATASKFAYEGKEYPLTDGHIGISCATPTEDNSFFAFEVYLFGPETDFTGLCPGFNASGAGNGISLHLSSLSSTGLSEGVYAEPSQLNINDEKLSSAIMYQYVNASGAGGSFVSKGMTGFVTVSKEEEVYTITFDLEVTPAFGGGAVTGKFIGELEGY